MNLASIKVALAALGVKVGSAAWPTASQINAFSIPSTSWNGSTNTPTLAAGTAPAGSNNSFTVTGCPTATAVSLGTVTSVINGDVIWFDGTNWGKISGIPSTSALLKGDGAGGITAAASSDYAPGPIIQRGIPAGMLGGFTFAANGVLSVGTQPVGVSITTSATTGSVTVTAAGGTPFSATTVGQVITLDGGKQITVTAFTDSTHVTGTVSGGTLSTTSFAAFTIGYPVNNGASDAAVPSPCWLYFPANSITASNVAGLYYTTLSNSTFGQVFNNVYTPGTNSPAVPGSPTAFSAAAGTTTTNATGTTFVTDQYTIPANFMGANGQIVIFDVMQNNNSSGTKVMDASLGGATLGFSGSNTTNTGQSRTQTISNVGVANKQWSNTVGDGATAGTTGANGHTTIDTTSAQVLALRVKLGANTDWVLSMAARATVYPAA